MLNLYLINIFANEIYSCPCSETDPTLHLHLHLHPKVRFNPNLCSHVWVASGGQTGIIRLNCVRVMITDYTQTIISKNQVQFEEQHSPKDKEEEQKEEQKEEVEEEQEVEEVQTEPEQR